MVSEESPLSRSPATRRRQGIRYLLSAALTAAFLWVAFRGTDMPKLVAAIRDANYWWIVAMLGVLLLSHFVRAWRWRYLLDPMKAGIGLRNLFSGVMIGYLFNNLLPRAGELARPYVIGRLESISKSAAFGTIVVERIIDTFSFLLLVALLPIVYDGPLLESFPWLQQAGIMITVATTAALASLVVLMARRDWTNRLLVALGRILPAGPAHRAEGLIHSFLDGFLFLKNPKSFSAILASSAAVWFLYILMVYVAFFAFDIDGLGFGAAIVVQTISSIGVAIPTPGGTGSYHAFTSQTLIKLFGVDPSKALSYATVTHAAGFIGVTVVGLWFFLRDHLHVAEAVGRRSLEEG